MNGKWQYWRWSGCSVLRLWLPLLFFCLSTSPPTSPQSQNSHVVLVLMTLAVLIFIYFLSDKTSFFFFSFLTTSSVSLSRVHEKLHWEAWQTVWGKWVAEGWKQVGVMNKITILRLLICKSLSPKMNKNLPFPSATSGKGKFHLPPAFSIDHYTGPEYYFGKTNKQ